MENQVKSAETAVDQDINDRTKAAESEQAEAAAVRKAKIDIFFASAGIILGIIAIVEGLKMPLDRLINAKWYTAPAFMPIVLSSILIIFCLILLVQSIRRSGGIHAEDVRKVAAYFKTTRFFHLVIAAGFLAVYVFVLLGNVHYILATFIYLAVNMLFFTTKKRDWKHILLLLVIAAVFATAVGLCFSKLAKIPLP